MARFFGVHLDTVRKAWRARGMPGKPGAWDLSEIVRWRYQETAQPNETAHGRLMRLKGDREELEVATLRGEYVAFEPVLRRLTRLVSEAKSLLDQLPEELLSLLPPDSPPELIAEFRSRAQRAIDSACSVVSETLADDDDSEAPEDPE